MTSELAFGRVLQRLRKEKKLSQEDLAFTSQLNRVFISRLENGHRRPTINTIIRLSRALGISASMIVAEVEEMLEDGGRPAI